MSVPFRVATPEERAYYERRPLPAARPDPRSRRDVRRRAGAHRRHGARAAVPPPPLLRRSRSVHASEPNPATLGRDVRERAASAGVRRRVRDRSGRIHAVVGQGRQNRMQVDVAPDSRRVEATEVSRARRRTRTRCARSRANKIAAFEDRSEVKDAVDLYHLTRRFSWAAAVRRCGNEAHPDRVRGFAALPRHAARRAAHC